VNVALKQSRVVADEIDMDLSAIALQGTQQAETQLNSVANALATGGASATNGANTDVADLSTEVVALSSAQNSFAINLSTLKTQTRFSRAHSIFSPESHQTWQVL